MAYRSNTPHWEAQKFTFLMQDQLMSGKPFTSMQSTSLNPWTDFNTETENLTKNSWKLLKMMFEAENCQTLIDNSTIKPKIPIRVLDAIQMTIKDEELFWH